MRELGLFLAPALALLGAMQRSPAASELYRKTEYRAALAALQPEQSRDPRDWHFARQIMFGLADYRKAQEWFEKAAAAEPKSSEHQHWLGKALGRRAETSSFLTAPKYASDCRKAFEKAVELDPRNLEAWSDLLEYLSRGPWFR